MKKANFYHLIKSHKTIRRQAAFIDRPVEKLPEISIIPFQTVVHAVENCLGFEQIHLL